MKNLSGIAPAVVDAFLNAGGRKKEGAVTAPPAEVQPSPRVPDSLGNFAAAVEAGAAAAGESLAEKQLKIRALMQAGKAKASETPPAPPVEPPVSAPSAKAEGAPAIPPRTGSGALSPDDIRAKHLAMRKPPAGAPNPPAPPTPPAGTGRLGGPPAGLPGGAAKKPLGTGRLGAPGGPAGPAGAGGTGTPGTGDLRMQHLALRNRGTGRLSEAELAQRTEKVERLVEGALGIEGALRLRQTIEALEDRGVPASLSSLTERVTALVPGSDGVVKLGADVGKKVLVNNLNPVLALSVAAKESAERLNDLKNWNEMSNKERMATTAGLSANLAEIIGAVTPPPVSFGAQIAAAGLTLVSLATEHSDTIEDVSKQAKESETTRKVANEVANRSAMVASQVKAAWDELGERIDAVKGKKGKPRAPVQLQKLFDSDSFKQLKKNPVTRNLAASVEDTTYEMTYRWRQQAAALGDRLDQLKNRATGSGPAKKKDERG